MIDQQTIQRVMEATDIVDVVKEFVTLRKSGANYKGLCPFHNEKTPSFMVSPAKGICKCFSCGKGGNVAKFVMEIEQISYPEAIKWLGRRCGIEVKDIPRSHEKDGESEDAWRERESKRESLFVVNEWAKNYFEHMLHNDPEGIAEGLAYFRSRGFRDDVIRKFSLGYASKTRNALIEQALAKGLKAEFLVETGLASGAEDASVEKLSDRFRGRVIFPIRTVSGRTVAFGGRILGSDKKVAKYVNSPESIIYSKSHELYGLFEAKQAIVRKGFCFLVEGYTDVISMHQAGVENVVASSGTSLTEGQIRLLHRFTQQITVLYDGDAAGIKASLRGIDMLLAEGLAVKVLLLPDGDDPDSFARKYPAEEFQAYIDAHQVDFIRFKTNLLLEDAKGDPLKRAALVSDVIKSVSVIPDDVTRGIYVTESASLLGVKEELVLHEIGKLRQEAKRDARKTYTRPDSLPAKADQQVDQVLEGGSRQQVEADIPQNSANAPSQTSPFTRPAVPEPRSAKQNQGRTPAEMLIALVIRYGECPMLAITSNAGEEGKMQPVATYIAQSLAADEVEMEQPLHRRILEEAVLHSSEAGWQALPYFTLHPDIAVASLATDLSEEDFVLSSRQKEQYVEEKYRLDEIVPRVIHDYKHRILQMRLKELLTKLRNPDLASKSEEAEKLMREYMELSAVERAFAQVLGDRVVLR